MQIQEDFARNQGGFEMDMNLASGPEQEIVIRMYLCVCTWPGGVHSLLEETNL